LITADTITDEQIRELLEHCSENGEGADDGHGGYYEVAVMLNMCDEALGDFEYGDAYGSLPMAKVLSLIEERRQWSRARCAEILEARRAKAQP
jgi:hypothetical protein